jgi:hypothetical protein
MNQEIIRMAREAGYGDAMADFHAPALERFFQAAYAAGAAAEREACARMAEAFHHHQYDFTGNLELHEAIRARGRS